MLLHHVHFNLKLDVKLKQFSPENATSFTGFIVLGLFGFKCTLTFIVNILILWFNIM